MTPGNTVYDPVQDTDVTLSPAQVQARDPAVAKENPELAALQAYQVGGDTDGLPGRLGSAVSGFLQRPNVVSNVLNKGPVAGGLAGGAMLPAD